MTTLAYPLPRQYPITRGFADTSITKVKSFGGLGAHTGLDLGAPCGVPVLAAGPGVVVRVINGAAALLNAGGRQIRITHSDSLTSEYLHLSVIYVREGQVVGAGAVIGSVGSSGAATGCHLHFQVNLNGQPIDPGPYIGLGSSAPAGSTVQATLAGFEQLFPEGTPICYPTVGEALRGAKPVRREEGAGCPAGQRPGHYADKLVPTTLGEITGSLFNLVLPALLEPALNLAILGTAALLIYSGIRQATSGG